MNQRPAPIALLLRWTVISLLSWLALTPTAAADIGSDWLAAQFQADGSVATADDLATAYQSTAETLRTWYALGESSRPLIPPVLQYLDNEPYRGTGYLSRLIQAKHAAGYGVGSWVDELLLRSNYDGGFGEWPGYDSNALDSALALDVLHNSGYGNSEKAYNAVDFLVRSQRADGGWENGGNASGVYVTAQAITALSPYQTAFQELPGALNAARNFLLSQRDALGLWNEDHLSATVLLALLANGAETSLVRPVAEALQNKQGANGNWSDDVYTTALALRALALYQAAASGTTGVSSGSVAGYILKANSDEPIANA
ncbi:MAG: hypothetical protein ACU837_13270, partial [Gammaproteobacteria bacterium]